MRERLIDWLVEQGLAPDDDISDQGLKDLMETEARRSFRDLAEAQAFVESPQGVTELTLGWSEQTRFPVEWPVHTRFPVEWPVHTRFPLGWTGRP